MKKAYRVLPFKIDRTLRTGLSVQLADALRTAIRTGFYAAGDILPPIRELSEMTGVSCVLVSRAIRILKNERLVNPRPHIGIEVCSGDHRLWKGQVLIIVPCGTIEYLAVVGDALRDSLTSAGYLPHIATVPHNEDGTYDFSLLDLMLRQQFDAVVQLHDQVEISGYLAAKNIPFVRFTQLKPKAYKTCLATVARKTDEATAAFVAACRKKRVKSVLQISMDSKRSVDVRKALAAAGIKVKEWKVVERGGRHLPGQSVARAAADAFKARLAAEGCRWLPDVLFFQDDYLTMGALTALQAAGTRIPEDVGVVTWANVNCGCGPVFVKPLARMETNAAADGAYLAKIVLDGLKSGRYETGEVAPAFIPGETF